MSLPIAENRWEEAVRGALSDRQIVAAIQDRANPITEKKLRQHLRTAAAEKEIWQHVNAAFSKDDAARSAFLSGDKKLAELKASASSRALDFLDATLALAIIHDDSVTTEPVYLFPERELGIGIREMAQATSRPYRVPIREIDQLTEPLLGFAGLVSLIQAGIVLWQAFFSGMPLHWKTFLAPPVTFKSAGTFVLFAIAIIYVMTIPIRQAVLNVRKKKLAPLVANRAYEFGSLISAADRDLEVLAAEMKRTTEAADRALEIAIRERLRLFIDRHISPNYSGTIPDLDTSGLAEIFDADQVIHTAARDELVKLMESMPGGSIGVAGPRGAGKSTLVKNVTEQSSLKTTSPSAPGVEAPVIGLFMSAPVKYDSREFILLLFSTLCEKLFQPEETRADAKTWQRALTREEKRSPWRYETTVMATLRTAATVARITAAAMVIMGVVFMFVSSPAPNAPLSSAQSIVAKFDLKAGSTIVQGLLLFLLSFVITRFLTTRPAEVPPATAETGESPLQRKPIAKPQAFGGGDAEWNGIIEAAEAWYGELRFQRTYTTGASGALKLPIGIEAGFNQAASLASRQLTLPELVDSYRDFVKQLTKWFVVIVGIDELDKIASAEKAQEFLNEVKAVFGMDRCFYLLSVSDSAMSSFARRGLPVRDAFDSAFDEVVRLGYMNLEESRRLLARRIVGLPRPVVAFCHDMSGGLPRDLIRACRSLLGEADRSGDRWLGRVGSNVLKKDLEAKIGASVTAVLEAGAPGETTDVLTVLWNFQHALEVDDSPQQQYPQLLDVAKTCLAAYQQTATQAKDASYRTLANIVFDLAAYLLYCATLMSLFARYGSENGFKRAQTRGLFDEAARFRQYLGLNSQHATVAIGSFRTKHRLPSDLMLQIKAKPAAKKKAQPRKTRSAARRAP